MKIFILLLLLVLLLCREYEYFENNEKLVIVTSHYRENLDWLKNSKYPVKMCDKPGSDETDFVADSSCTLNENFGREASSYLTYIINNYDNLPEYMAFLHGHEEAYHQKNPLGILKAIEMAKIDEYDYISLNNEIQAIILEPGLTFDRNNPSFVFKEQDMQHYLMRRVWKDLYEPYLGYPFPEKIRCERSAQFIVSKKAVLNRPKKMYEDLLHFLSYGEKEFGILASFVLEFSWHMIFGEKPDMCDTDPNDPLYNSCTNETYHETRFVLTQNNL
jgi:hypothetical protein